MYVTSQEVYNSIFIVAGENNKFELYTQPLDDEFSYIHLRDDIAEILDLSDISPKDLQHGINWPDLIKTYRKLSLEKSQTDGYHMLFIRYSRSPIRDFEIYLRILTGENQDDIQLMLKQ